MATAFIGIGANVGERRGHCERAVALLSGHPAIRVAAVAPWRSYPALTAAPDEVQPDYINGAVRVETTLDPLSLLAICQEIEARLGRVRREGERWAPRPIDIDILFYDEIVLRTPELTIPHPEMTKRLFVLEPLADIAPAVVHPGLGKSIQALLSEHRHIDTSVHRHNRGGSHALLHR